MRSFQITRRLKHLKSVSPVEQYNANHIYKYLFNLPICPSLIHLRKIKELMTGNMHSSNFQKENSDNGRLWPSSGRLTNRRSRMSTDSTCRKASEFREEYRRVEQDDESCLNCFRCNKKRAKNCINSMVPSYRIMKKYQWKTDFVADIICGLTVGIMQLPQGKSNLNFACTYFIIIRQFVIKW